MPDWKSLAVTRGTNAVVAGRAIVPMLLVLPQVLIVPSIFCAAKPPPLA